ncbi:MAG: hypothetical protein A2X22_08550 [Bacteroidetes bacterium GWF2_49_14]|nr:MAG: hypothetical protein A2X22_08550 [Bacteroidetes bacterium GWF2_49_14]HBB92479.1 hypothetical protein [Bacteroidales bacterium]
MKTRISLIVIFLIGMGGMANGQVLSYGARLGMGFPGFYDEDIASQRITLATGLVGSLRITDAFQIMTEIGYQRKGNKYTNQFWDAQGNVVDDSTYLVKTNMDYITIPLYFRLNLGRSNKFYLQAGGYYGYLLHSNFTGMRLGQMEKRVSLADGLGRHDFGLVAGGGIETPIRQGLSVVLDIKYQLGLKDLNIDPLVIGNSKPLKNKGLMMSMGFIVDIE